LIQKSIELSFNFAQKNYIIINLFNQNKNGIFSIQIFIIKLNSQSMSCATKKI